MASIERYKEKRWRARYRTPGGESRSQVFDRKLDAQRWLAQVEHQKLTGAYIDPAAGRTTVAEYWTTWSKRQLWRDSSRMSITSLFERHVLPGLGDWPLGRLHRGDIEAWTARLPLAGRTARQVAGYVSTMLDAAVDDGHLASNPARGARLPRVDAEPIVPFTDADTDALQAAAPPWFRVALTLGLGAGLRQAEATGLSVDRIDFLRRQLTIDRQLVSPKAGECTLGPPKTARSYRAIPLADAVIEGLARHIEDHGTGQHGLVLHLVDGRPIRRQRFGRIWHQLRGDAGLSAARFHDSRHTYASVLLSGGVPVPAAAEYLGHTPAVLLRTYAHLLPADHDRARSVVEAAFARGLDVACHPRVTDAGR
jgi:integrase